MAKKIKLEFNSEEELEQYKKEKPINSQMMTCEDCGKEFDYFVEGGLEDERCDSCWNKNQEKGTQ